jgi:hypothetical protein
MESVAHSFCQPFDCHTPFSSPFKSHVFHLCPVESQVSNQRPFETQTVPCMSPSRHSVFPSSSWSAPCTSHMIKLTQTHHIAIFPVYSNVPKGRAVFLQVQTTSSQFGSSGAVRTVEGWERGERERGGDVFVFIEGKQLLLWTPFLVRPLKSRVRSTAVRRCSFSV